MWRLHRYYLKELMVHSGITFLVLFAVVMVSLVARGIQRSGGGELGDAALITLFWTLDALPHLVTIAFLLATVTTYTRAVQDRELIAVRAAGIAPATAMAPAVLAGLVLSVFASTTIHYVIPEIHFRKYRVIAEVLRNFYTNFKLGSDRIPLLKTGYVMTFRAQEEKGLYLECTVYGPPDKPLRAGMPSIVLVDQVSIPPIDQASESVVIHLAAVHDPVTGLDYGNLTIDIPAHDILDQDRRDEREDDICSDQLLAEYLRGAGNQPYRAAYVFCRRCVAGLMPVVLAPVGYALAELARDRGRVVALVLALVPLVLFYAGEMVGARLMSATRSAWPAWLPLGFLAVFGVPLCWRQLRR
jgi:lipopolysaccharide export LptBFGC system permease protein LptF